MSATTWRMYGLRSEAAVALLLCVLLINSGVRCQSNNPTVSTSSTVYNSNLTTTTGANAATSSILDSTSALPAQNASAGNNTSHEDAVYSPDLGNEIRGDGNEGSPVAPEVMCVTKEQVEKNIAVSAVVNTRDCMATKNILKKNPVQWCPKAPCHLHIFQEGNAILMASPNATKLTMTKALEGETLKEKLGVSNVQSHSSAGSTVFVGVLLAGLFLAAALIGGYCLKMRRGTDQKGMRLAEEAYPVDEQNQGNTLVSVAPLSPPEKPESQEKPSVNGETPEPTQEPTPEAPPSNGHSSAKTADTEL